MNAGMVLNRCWRMSVYAGWRVADGQSDWLVGWLVFKRMWFVADGTCHLWHYMELMMYF